MMGDDLDIKIESLLLDKASESAIEEKNKEATRKYLKEQAGLMKIAINNMDVYNLRHGPYTNTVLAKVKLCREVLQKNGEQILPNHVTKIEKTLNRLDKLIAKKVAYGTRIDKYLERKEDSLIESIRSNLLDLDLQEFEMIRTKLLGFKNDLISVGEKLDKAVSSCKCLKPAPEDPVVAVEPVNLAPQQDDMVSTIALVPSSTK